MRLMGPLLLYALAVALPGAALAAAAPRMPITSFEQLAKPLPFPYDERADADRAVEAALQRGRRSHKLVLIDLGGNWCLDCRLLAGTMAVPVLRTWLARHYEIVAVDVGRFTRNLQIPARFRMPGKPEGVPAVLIVDPRTRRVINAGRTTALADARSMSPQGLADWLAQWTR